MINGQNEIWKKVERKIRRKRHNNIIAVSNCGRVMYANGEIKFSNYEQQILVNGKFIHIYRVFAELFVDKSEDDIMYGRNIVDHITHEPVNMNINDIRNLRWCTRKENHNFDEVKNKMKLKHKHLSSVRTSFGKKFTEKYGIVNADNKSLYNKLYYRYKTYGEEI